MALRDPRARAMHHLHPRNPDPTGSQSFGDPTDMMGDLPHEAAKQFLIPAIANRTRNAINVDRREIFLYQRLRSGRRCRCWASGEAAPHAGCPVCHATGFAGGFHKHGTDLYVFDPSRQWWGVNTIVNPLMGLPPWFTLETGATFGYVEWDQEMDRTTYFGLDSSYFEYRQGQGRCKLEMRLTDYDVAWIPYSEAVLTERILQAAGRRLRFRVTMTRQTPNDKSPSFLQHWFRPLVLSAKPPVLFVDIPRRNESNVLAEYGALETFQPIQFVFSDTVQRVNLEDMILRLYDMTRWKVIEESPNDPANILTSHDVQARKVFQWEAAWKIPQ